MSWKLNSSLHWASNKLTGSILCILPVSMLTELINHFQNVRKEDAETTFCTYLRCGSRLNNLIQVRMNRVMPSISILLANFLIDLDGWEALLFTGIGSIVCYKSKPTAGPKHLSNKKLLRDHYLEQMTGKRKSNWYKALWLYRSWNINEKVIITRATVEKSITSW